MGIPGRFDHAEFQAALHSVVEAARRHGKLAGIQPSDREQAESWLRAGFQILSWTTDIALYRTALQREIAELKKLTEIARVRGV